jgi:hypothetical protein
MSDEIRTLSTYDCLIRGSASELLEKVKESFSTTRKGPDILVVPIMTVFVPIVTKYT